MPVVKNTFEENYLFFLRELSRINHELGRLPKGSISVKKIGGIDYHYHQWREGKKVKSVLIGREAPPDLIRKINRRKTLEAQKKEILDNLEVIVKAVDPQAVTVHEILRLFSQHKINVLLIGSYCLPAYKDAFNMKLPTLRTQDVDFLVPQPYKGKKADMESILSDLGFSLGFNPDGSTYFTNGTFRIDFLTPEKGKGTDKAVLVKELGIHAEPLRYMQMLFDDPIQVKSKDLKYSVPNPWIFAFHKILIMKSRKAPSKKDKDLLQVVSILREIKTRPREWGKSRQYLNRLPPRWQRTIKEQVEICLPDFLG
ncbi:MAG: GSU2403 family nucleotidyltransferase fold protein [Nitrospirota bacterium]